MGDVVFPGLSCLNPDCDEFWFIRQDTVLMGFRLPCPKCGEMIEAGQETRLFDFELSEEHGVRAAGEFSILHDDHLNAAPRFKYCINCSTLRPLEAFGRHAARRSGRQGECRLCKDRYNDLKNPTRTADQHREAAARRRLFRLLSGEGLKLDTAAAFQRFNGRCFNCDRVVTMKSKGDDAATFDHTLPVKYLWPIRTDSATLLCRTCNGTKHDLWPSEFYESAAKLRALSVRTSLPFALLSGPPVVNPDAVAEILKDVDGFIEAWVHYPEDVKKVRRLILEGAGVDIFDQALNVPAFLKDPQPNTAME